METAMPSRDHHTMMTLQLERWNTGRPLRAYEIECEMARLRQPKPVRRKWVFRLSPFWRRSEA